MGSLAVLAKQLGYMGGATVSGLVLGARVPIALTSRADAPNDNPQQETSAGFGISLGNLTPQIAQQLRLDAGTRGAVIVEVDPDSSAARAGLQPRDVIVRVGRQAITSAAEAQRELARVAAGSTAFLRVIRNGQEQFVTITKEAASLQR